MGYTRFKIRTTEMGIDLPLFVIAGPCVIENEASCLRIAEWISRVGRKTETNMIFKASFDKANRSSINNFRGPGITEGLKILDKVRNQTGLPVMTDVHEPWQASTAASIVDCLQIPAFLCRQTDLLSACAQTGKPVNVKKGQFMSPKEMRNVVKKFLTYDNNQILLTERGTFFGYNHLVNDMTAIYDMGHIGYPVVFDATHSTQLPGKGGRREMAFLLAKAAVAAGANGLFLEVHPIPEMALCDSDCAIPLNWLEDIIKVCKQIRELVRNN
jgi:2-dehydro-3-deoxyphosphooctonate aldolase (KDO 8-P synthase)